MTAPSAALVKRIAIVAPDAASLRRTRGDLIAAIAARRHGVLLLAPAFDAKTAAWAAAAGFAIAEYPEPQTRRLWSSGASEKILIGHLRDWQPHCVLAYGPASLQVGVRAARRAGPCRVVGLINRIDAIGNSSERPIRWLARSETRRTIDACDAIVFHNRDDARRIEDLAVTPAQVQRTIVTGAGVDLVRFANAPLPPIGKGLVVAMLAKLDRSSGALEFAEAARRVRERAPSVRFLLAGPPGHGVDAIRPDQLQRYSDAIELHGEIDDVPAFLASAHLFVRPSHGEGMPRATLEALAIGRPVITTDTPGCRDTVDERVNGVLVPPRDATALADAIESVLKRPDLIPAMARASRQKAERRFDMQAVNATLLQILEL